MSILYCPFPSIESAKTLAHDLVESKLAFCCNTIPSVTSIFFWEGKTQESDEVLLIVKVLASDPQPTIDHLESQHPYDLPFIACWPITINQRFLDSSISICPSDENESCCTLTNRPN